MLNTSYSFTRTIICYVVDNLRRMSRFDNDTEELDNYFTHITHRKGVGNIADLQKGFSLYCT